MKHAQKNSALDTKQFNKNALKFLTFTVCAMTLHVSFAQDAVPGIAVQIPKAMMGTLKAGGPALDVSISDCDDHIAAQHRADGFDCIKIAPLAPAAVAEALQPAPVPNQDVAAPATSRTVARFSIDDGTYPAAEAVNPMGLPVDHGKLTMDVGGGYTLTAVRSSLNANIPY